MVSGVPCQYALGLSCVFSRFCTTNAAMSSRVEPWSCMYFRNATDCQAAGIVKP